MCWKSEEGHNISSGSKRDRRGAVNMIAEAQMLIKYSQLANWLVCGKSLNWPCRQHAEQQQPQQLHRRCNIDNFIMPRKCCRLPHNHRKLHTQCIHFNIWRRGRCDKCFGGKFLENGNLFVNTVPC